MKIVHVEAGRNLYGGARQVQHLLDGLAGAGVDNVLVAPRGSAILDAVGSNVRAVAVPLAGDHDIGFVWRLRRLLRAERPDIVHLHSRRGADTLGGIAARGAEARVVLSRRVDSPEPRWLVGPKYALYDKVIAISRAIADILERSGVPAAKIHCVKSAVDPTLWRSAAPREELEREFGLCAGLKLIGVAAQFIERKGHRQLFEALPNVIEAHPDVHVLLFGKGPLEGRLKGRAAAQGLTPHVTFAGFRNDLPRWLGALDLLVHPALTEGLGVVLLQAGAAGIPAVATRAGGMGEVIVDGETGVLVPPGDVASLAGVITHLMSDDEARREMGRRAAARIDAHFSVPAMVAGTLRVYDEALGGAFESEDLARPKS